ncbi:hypothetical protein EC973_004058 [Apophysomyces ossiformis]|uniref:RING-type domain-containing protein n=1 Tax=Apophysomyces ossiformis TaxID=679940 RepID=A0A8H7BF18_9FUNG|nr:hypothetical protein EC973_004058 [Apophysomyces ossiformis]
MSRKRYIQLRKFLLLYVEGLAQLLDLCDEPERIKEQFHGLLAMVTGMRQSYCHHRFYYLGHRVVAQYRWLSGWRRHWESTQMITNFCNRQIYFIETASICINHGEFTQKQIFQTLRELQVTLRTSLPQSEDYCCPICLTLLYKPATLEPCHHSLCHDCFDLLEKHDSKPSCPVCRTVVTAVRPDQALTNLIELYFPQEVQQSARDRRGIFHWLSGVAAVGGLLNQWICVALAYSNPVWQIYQEQLNRGQTMEDYYEDLSQAQAANHVKAIETEAGERGLVKTLEALVLHANPTSTKQSAQADGKKPSRKPFASLFAPTPSSMLSGAAWTAEALLNDIRNTLGLTAQNTKAIKEALFTFSFSQQKVLARGLIERLLSKDFPSNDRDNTFENVMAIFGKAGPHQQDLINMFTDSLTQTFYDDIKKPYLNVLGNEFRSADGSGNSVLFPDIGKAGTQYVRTVSPLTKVFTGLPDADVVFDRLLKRPENHFSPHETGVNMLLFYLATIITHDLFYSDPRDLTKNLTTGYADLSPLYGKSLDEQKSVRQLTKGLLKPDQWADKRLIFQPPGVGALMVLFSRNHNFIAQRLLEINENERFSYGPGNALKDETEQDEVLFQTARLVNNGCYTNIILHEYLRTILGASGDSNFTFNPLAAPAYPIYGNQVSIEFNYVYRWHASLGQKDEEWLNKLMSSIGDVYAKRSTTGATNPRQFIDDMIKQFNDVFVHASDEELQMGNPISGVHRSIQTGQFSDFDLARILHEGRKQVAGELGSGLNTPAALKQIEVTGIKQSRIAKTCRFNDFRRHFNLLPLKSFSDFSDNVEVQKALQDLYQDVENVELFAGLRVEKSVPSGLRLPYTMKRAILSDAVNLLRNDRILAQSLTPTHLTNWGYNYIQGDPKSSGRVLPQMLRELLPKANSNNTAAFSDEELTNFFNIPGAAPSSTTK